MSWKQGILALVLVMATRAHADEPARPAEFIKWAQTSQVPLASDDSLGRMIGRASVVALSEAVHEAAEPLEFRNRVLKYLVEKKGFTAIAIESGLVEGRTVHDYVLGGRGNLADVLAQGIGWTFDQLPQNRSLVRWLREYNEDPRHARKVNFYGFDVPGSPGNPQARRGVDTALIQALNYLSSVDGAAAAGLHARIDVLLPNLRFDPTPGGDGPGYDRLKSSERDALTAAIADLIALLERCEARYVAATSQTDYQWAYRAAIGARQADGWLREMPAGWQRATGKLDFLPAATNVRDRAQADNVEWILQQEGPAGKVLLFAARFHSSGAPVKLTIPAADGVHQPEQQVAGTYLRRRLGDRLVTIGSLLGSGTVGCTGSEETLPPPSAESIDGLAGRVGSPRFLLDLRKAPAPLAAWLDEEQQLGSDAGALRLPVRKGFDVLYYLDTVSPACSGRD